MATHQGIKNRELIILCHNIRGINSDVKQNAIRSKIQETGCDIVCIQEIKREMFDQAYIKKNCPNVFDSFFFIPSLGSSGGSIIIWKGNKLQGEVVLENDYARSVEFMSKLNGQKWILTNIYAPCTADGKVAFLNWFKNIYMPEEKLWIVLGDFNLIIRPKNRNKPGGDSNLMLAFNEAISKLGIIEPPLSGQ
jgi:exonuclease III